MTRLKGFSAKQLFLTFSGTGAFRPLGQENWDIIAPHTLLYIPAGFPHEYVPQGQEPWYIGFVTFVEKRDGLAENWGFGESPFQLELRDMDRLYGLLEQIWVRSGPMYDVWEATGHFFSFCIEIKKQTAAEDLTHSRQAEGPVRYRDSVVDSAVRFLQDHLQRSLSMEELASHVGYSPKRLNRLFQKALGTTPMQYLQRIRLSTAARLLEEHPSMTVRQAAAHIGMEPVYFTRLFRRAYGVVPSEYKKSF
ncbi:AraC family transcriptional regulator [Paenibacillus sp. P25]|nr:AraC family transcriptional regulator [Paenibacillus sp. P25]